MEVAFREYVVIAAGFLIGLGLISNTWLRRRREWESLASGRQWGLLEACARLLCGAGLVLLSLWVLIGRTLWQSGRDQATPSWAAPVGVALVLICGVSVLIIGGCYVRRRFGIAKS